MVSIAVLDDEEIALKETRDCLDRYFNEIHEKCSISEFQNPLSFMSEYTPRYDIIILDIQMEKENGIEIARKIRNVDPLTIIVFVTNMANLAVKGYEVDASDFIVKPLEFFSFKMKMNRIMERVKQNDDSGFVLINTANGKIKTKPSEIKYVEVFQHHLIYHLNDGDYSAYGSLSQVESDLGEDFSRPANCYLVNLRYVKKIDGYDLLLSGSKETMINISHAKKKTFMDDLNRYIGKGKMYVL